MRTILLFKDLFLIEEQLEKLDEKNYKQIYLQSLRQFSNKQVLN